MTMFAVNLTKTNVSMIDGRYLIEIGGWLPLRDEDARHYDVQEAERRGWIRLTDKKPAPAKPFVPNIKIEKAPTQGSSTPPKKKVKA